MILSFGNSDHISIHKNMQSYIYYFLPFLGLDRCGLMMPRLCPDCARDLGFDSKRVRHKIDVFLLECGSSFMICSACGRQVTVNGGARRLMGLLEGSYIRSIMRKTIRHYKNGIIG